MNKLMNNDVQIALSALKERALTCVLCCDGELIEFRDRGVAPLLSLLEGGRDVSGFSAADKVVGAAAAYLYVLLGVRCVYALTVSKMAAEVFLRFGIEYRFDTVVDKILNRTGDGFCPMESAVIGVKDPNEARIRILKKLDELKR